ncbi:short-chain dehydrogenase/reductase SDR family domain-containing protein [Rhizobium sp. TAL182]|nr:short-chain dehydrogenase/reductase SDR family domain-containing protein [Rhizobium sp. TAL182]
MADKPRIHVCDVYPALVDTPGLRHGANYVGRQVTAPPPVLDACRVAEAIVGVARSPRATTTVGVVTTATRLAHLLVPHLAARALGRLMAAYFKRAPRAAESDGNLYWPSTDAARIDGGLRSRHRYSAPLLLGLIAVAVLAIGAAAPRTYPRRRLALGSRHRFW